MFETVVTSEEEKEAVRLGLPPKFFAYKQLPDCKCDQCKKDDVYLKELFESSVQKPKSVNIPQTTIATSTPSIFTTYKTSATASPFTSSTTTSNTSQSSTIQQLLVKPSIFGNLSLSENKNQTPVTSETSNAFNTFTFTLNPAQTTTTTTTTDSNKPVFGGGPFAFGSKTTSIFGTPAVTTSNVFGLASNTAAATTTTTSLFGSNSGLFSTSNTSLFGSGLFKTGESIFGTPASDNKPTFGTPSVFGAKLGSAADSNISSAEPFKSQNTSIGSSGKDIVLPSDPNLSFASLAACSPNKPVFGKKAGNDLYFVV